MVNGAPAGSSIPTSSPPLVVGQPPRRLATMRAPQRGRDGEIANNQERNAIATLSAGPTPPGKEWRQVEI